jgi:hypothetical protein
MKSRNTEITKGDGNGLQPYARFLSSPDWTAIQYALLAVDEVIMEARKTIQVKIDNETQKPRK